MVIKSLAAAAVVLCGAACAVRSQTGPPVIRTPAPGSAPVTATLRTDKKAYSPNDSVKLRFTVKNPAKSPVALMFSSGQKYDFEIRKGKTRNGESVWKWSNGRMFIQMITRSSIEPGKSLTFSETYRPGDKSGDGKAHAALAPGVYTATATLALTGRAPRPTASATFTVK